MVSENEFFYFKNGKKASNIEELKTVLTLMEEGEYNHHVMSDNNDFANWIEHVFKEKELASNMKAHSKKEETLKILSDFLEKKKLVPNEDYVEIEEPARIIKKDTIPQSPEIEIHKDLTPKPEFHEKPKPIGTPVAQPKEKSFEEPKLSEPNLKKIVEEAKGAIHEQEDLDKLRKEITNEPIHDEASRKKARKTVTHSHHPIIVKEFIYGLLFGLLLGLFLFGILRSAGILM